MTVHLRQVICAAAAESIYIIDITMAQPVFTLKKITEITYYNYT